MPLIGSPEATEEALQAYRPAFKEEFERQLRGKLGLEQSLPEDAALFEALFDMLQESRADFTLFFRELGGILKAGTIMFGENLDGETLAQAGTIAKACRIFWAVGTSLTVQPAASLCAIAMTEGARTTIVNAQPTPYDPVADEVIRDPIGEALPRMVAALIAAHPS